MYNVHKPDASELPSSGKLLRSTGIAALIAGVLLTTVVLPAEYAVDPTGVGQLLGLTEMGRVKRSLAAEAAAETAAAEGAGAADAENLLALEALPTTPAAAPAGPTSPSPTSPSAGAAVPQSHVTTLTLAPDQGAEIKLVMREGASARYVWETDGGSYVLDPTFNWMAARADQVGEQAYVPLYAYAGEQKFRAASIDALVANN